VATTGFQVTVDTVGFQQSDAGRRELTCIASATGGTYFDASDSEKLIEHFEIIAKSRLALSVSSPSVVTLGTQATIAVTVTNPSIRQVNDVRVNLSFVADDKLTSRFVRGVRMLKTRQTTVISQFLQCCQGRATSVRSLPACETRASRW
jgi:hypothetical protein